MKFVIRFFAITAMIFSSSCAMMMNDKLDKVTIESSPPGADIFIEGRNYGQTPKTLNIIPKEYNITVRKAGYGSAQIQTSYWAAAKNSNCVADTMGAIFLVPIYSFYYSGYCNEFKEKSYSVVIPRNEAPQSNNRGRNGDYNSRNRGYNYNDNSRNRGYNNYYRN